MTNNTLTDVSNGGVVPNDWNQYKTALNNDFVGRNGVGAPEAGKKNGTAVIPWGEVHTGNLYLNGKLFDPDNLGSSGNGVISGQVRSSSQMPDFIRANGAAPSLLVLGATTNLSVNIDNTGTTVSSDLTLGSLDLAPASNNTALINDASLTGDASSKYAGESGSTISLDNVGSEITDRAGQYVALKHVAGEIMFARIVSADAGAGTAVLDNVFRGYFFDSSGEPIIREPLSDNDILTLYNLAWLFLQSDGTTLDVTYRTPTWSYTEPTSPQIDDYWHDLNTQKWMRYNGTLFQEINRILIGWVVVDGANCIASRCIDFSKNFNDHISIETHDTTNTTISSKGHNDSVHVYGDLIVFGNSPAIWDITANLESGLIEASNQFLYLYVTEKGKTVLSDIRPYNRKSDLRGHYHPYHSWRYVGVAYNDTSSDISAANSHNLDDGRVDYITSSGTLLTLPHKIVKCTVHGGGGGGGGQFAYGVIYNGSNGQSSSIGTLFSATGGTRGLGETSTSSGANGSNGSGSGGLWSFFGYGGVANGGNGATAGTRDGGDGGDGGCTIGFIAGTPKAFQVTVGNGGAGGNSVAQDGAAGSNGIIIVEYL